MNNTQPESPMESVEQVIQDPLRFKLKLDIGEEAYTSLRLKSYLMDSVDAANGAATGMAVAQSSLVASTFFAKTGFLGALGIGAAATPIGWAVAAGIAGAGLSVVVGKYFVRSSSSRAKTIPDFINTPLDVLATGLFDMIAMLGIKLASIDGTIDHDEREFIKASFVKEWGYDETFVAEGLALIERKADEHSIKEISEQLARFKKENPDCNYKSMSNEIISFITGIAEADGIFDEREEMAIARVHQTFADVNSFSTAFSETTKAGMEGLSRQGKSAMEGLSSGFQATKKGFNSLGQKSKTVFSQFGRKDKDSSPKIPPDVS
ncbi:tellurite resistance TerB family protein [Marinobacter similis]|uniref:Co-chaperone DjlA N-terminal domain-containing protein n=1 Tax=Marinobacter similis TaxID=1420916 RepID=W5YFK6_9GAMM|nr:TerB family tellurite resistance protein [Marinobacter similis]AHI27856.1 hypothetical protein AU14_01890 [Marinobacter similis]